MKEEIKESKEGGQKKHQQIGEKKKGNNRKCQEGKKKEKRKMGTRSNERREYGKSIYKEEKNKEKQI